MRIKGKDAIREESQPFRIAIMIAKSDAQRQAARRERQRSEGLTEVRGIWAPAELHAAIRQKAASVVRAATKRSKANAT